MTPVERLVYWVEERERMRALQASVRARVAAKQLTQEAFDKALDGMFTRDPILGEWRFCNVRREDDRVTAWIRENVRERWPDHPLLWLMLCICRHFNWPPTIERLFDTPGWPDSRLFSPAAVIEELSVVKKGKLYTGAYVVPAPPTGGSKLAWSAETAIGELYRRRNMFEAHFDDKQTLAGTHSLLSLCNGWGPFLAYQAVVDMRFTKILGKAKDRETWCAVGPGTLRGLNRLHGRPYESSLTRLASPEVQSLARAEVIVLYQRLAFLTDVEHDLSDVPNILCEFDKYERVRLGEGQPRARYRPWNGSW